MRLALHCIYTTEPVFAAHTARAVVNRWMPSPWGGLKVQVEEHTQNDQVLFFHVVSCKMKTIDMPLHTELWNAGQ